MLLAMTLSGIVCAGMLSFTIFHLHCKLLKQHMHSPIQCKIQSVHNILYNTGISYANKSTLKMRSSEDYIVKMALLAGIFNPQIIMGYDIIKHSEDYY